MGRPSGSSTVRPQADGRRKWKKTRVKGKEKIGEKWIQTLSTQPMSMDAVQRLIASIAELDIESLPSVIDLVRPVENSVYQPELIDACLRRILQALNPGAHATATP